MTLGVSCDLKLVRPKMNYQTPKGILVTDRLTDRHAHAQTHTRILIYLSYSQTDRARRVHACTQFHDHCDFRQSLPLLLRLLPALASLACQDRCPPSTKGTTRHSRSLIWSFLPSVRHSSRVHVPRHAMPSVLANVACILASLVGIPRTYSRLPVT